MGNWFEKLQSIGKALMLPIAVLPAAALLLRLGAPDVLNIPFITKAGGAVFDNLALIFAIGIGVGLAKDNNGAAGLAGGIGYLILTAGLKAIDKDLNMSVLAGIISGIEAGLLYNRFHAIKLPEFLGFLRWTEVRTDCHRRDLDHPGRHIRRDLGTVPGSNPCGW
ncbi:MAG: PTS transporter subunit EIIC [Selenomonas sp.]|jgi:PTS system N-acetylglucosamine-specific IIC component|nr:PTS transporter subunit EIIC [Selenomonas sp.]